MIWGFVHGEQIVYNWKYKANVLQILQLHIINTISIEMMDKSQHREFQTPGLTEISHWWCRYIGRTFRTKSKMGGGRFLVTFFTSLSNTYLCYQAFLYYCRV